MDFNHFYIEKNTIINLPVTGSSFYKIDIKLKEILND